MPGDDDFGLWLGHVGADRGVTGRLARARRLGSAGSARGAASPAPPSAVARAWGACSAHRIASAACARAVWW